MLCLYHQKSSTNVPTVMETQQTADIWDDSLSNLFLSNSETLMSDENIAQELALQEALFSSFTTPQKPTSETAESSKMGAKRGSKRSSSHTLCDICAERKGNTDIFPLHCVHNYCTDCISKHVTILINKRRTSVNQVVTCPASDCTAVLESHTLRAVLPAEVVSVWDDVLCESLINPNSKYYCPYKDCSGLLVRESGNSELIRESECPFCHRLFCAKCNVAWHSGIGCEERERLKVDERERESELKLHDLAKKRKWQRCPNCKFYVDKKEGCLHMTCRCGFQFCYSCGKAWTSTHGGCS